MINKKDIVNSETLLVNPEWVSVGITSCIVEYGRVTDNHIIMIDYDRKTLKEVISDIVKLMFIYKLGDFYLFQSSKDSYHAVCFDVVNIEFYKKILNDSVCDNDYKQFFQDYKTLRISRKILNDILITDIPRFIHYIESPYIFFKKKSRAHTDFYRNVLNLKVNHYRKLNQKRLFINKKSYYNVKCVLYKTYNHGGKDD